MSCLQSSTWLQLILVLCALDVPRAESAQEQSPASSHSNAPKAEKIVTGSASIRVFALQNIPANELARLVQRLFSRPEIDATPLVVRVSERRCGSSSGNRIAAKTARNFEGEPESSA